VNVECCGEECACVSGGLVWGKKCTAVLLGRSARSLQELCSEVAPHASGRSCASGMDRPYCMCESRNMRTGIQCTRNREVFRCEPVECMGAVYSRADRKLSMRMQRECMGGEYVHVKTESYQHRYKIEARGKEGR
jgi:hypothetical protein